MSVQALAYVLGDEGVPAPRFSSAELLVLIVLADHADDKGECWPTVTAVANQTRLSQRKVRQCIAVLAAAGELEVIDSSGATLYRLLGYLFTRQAAKKHALGMPPSSDQ